MLNKAGVKADVRDFPVMRRSRIGSPFQDMLLYVFVCSWRVFDCATALISFTNKKLHKIKSYCIFKTICNWTLYECQSWHKQPTYSQIKLAVSTVWRAMIICPCICWLYEEIAKGAPRSKLYWLASPGFRTLHTQKASFHYNIVLNLLIVRARHAVTSSRTLCFLANSWLRSRVSIFVLYTSSVRSCTSKKLGRSISQQK